MSLFALTADSSYGHIVKFCHYRLLLETLDGWKVLLPTGKMGCDEEERCAKEDKGHSHSSLGLDLRDDPGCDCGVLHFCAGQQGKCCGY